MMEEKKIVIEEKNRVVWGMSPSQGELTEKILSTAEECDYEVSLTLTAGLCKEKIARYSNKRLIPIKDDEGKLIQRHVIVVPEKVWRVGMSDFIVFADVILADGKEPGDDAIVSGDIFADGTTITFYWSTELQWGTIYLVETTTGVYKFRPSPAHPAPLCAITHTTYRLPGDKTVDVKEVKALINPDEYDDSYDEDMDYDD